MSHPNVITPEEAVSMEHYRVIQDMVKMIKEKGVLMASSQEWQALNLRRILMVQSAELLAPNRAEAKRLQGAMREEFRYEFSRHGL